MCTLFLCMVSPGCGTVYNLSSKKGIAVMTPFAWEGLMSSSPSKVPDWALRWKRRGVKLNLPGSEEYKEDLLWKMLHTFIALQRWKRQHDLTYLNQCCSFRGQEVKTVRTQAHYTLGHWWWHDNIFIVEDLVDIYEWQQNWYFTDIFFFCYLKYIFHILWKPF